MAAESVKVEAQTLRTLHRIHRQRTDLKSQLRRGPLQLQAGQASVEAAKTARDQAKDAVKKAKMSADQRQLQLRSNEQKVESLKVRLNQAASNKEYQLIKDQIAAEEQVNSVTADEILEILEKIDQLNLDITARETELKEIEGKQKKLEMDVETRMKIAAEDLAKVDAELVEVEKLLPAHIRTEYQRVVSSRGEEALASVDSDNTCSGCYQTLNLQMLNRLFLNDLVYCPNCGAMLYLPENRTVN